MKIVCITDSHSGARQDNPHFYPYQKNFYDNVFFPYIEKYKPDAFLHLGDIVENRKTMNYSTLRHLREDFLYPLKNFNMDTFWIAGNHDSHYKNNLSINAMNEFVDLPGAVIADYPMNVDFGLLVPWICKSNREECEARIHISQADHCFGHFELKGFKDNNGRLSTYGDDSNFLRGFKTVLSGHYHERSKQANITYLGAAFEYTWSDYNSFRGFSVFDTDSSHIEFFRNPYHIFSKIDYTGGNELTPGDIGKIKNTYCRVYRKDVGGTDTEFNDFVKRVEDVGVIDLTIIEKSDIQVMEIGESVIEADNLKDIMLNYIDTQQLSNPDLIRNRFIDLYGRANNTK